MNRAIGMGVHLIKVKVIRQLGKYFAAQRSAITTEIMKSSFHT